MDVKKERNYGIDLLRVLSMFFVVVLHSYGNGGILTNTIENTTQYKIAWFIEIIAYCAVDVFALISGYVCYKKNNNKINFSRFINLWFQVVFYGLIISLIFNIYNPSLVTKDNYLRAIFPISNNMYWYFTAYAGLFLLIPFINNAINGTDIKSLKKLFILIILIFSVYEIFFKVFSLANGYSFVWILILYVLGAIIKKCEIGKKLKNIYILVGIVILTMITYIYKMYGFTEGAITKDLFISYCSPTIIGISILYLIGFSRIKFNDTMKKIISFSSISTFSIYLINTNELVWNNSINSIFISLSNNTYKLVLQPIIFSVIFVICALLIDKIRIIIFKILHIRTLCNFLDNKIESLLNIITK